MATKQLQCNLVGDLEVGKLCLASGEIVEEYTPITTRVRKMEVTFKSRPVTLILFISVPLDSMQELRRLAYRGTDVFMVCFSLMKRESMDNILSKWIPEVRSFSETVPILLVGTQMDLRTNEEEIQRLWDRKQEKPISTEEGKNSH